MSLNPATFPSKSPTGAAGGDLSGTYPNPAVAKVNGIAVTGTPSTGYVPTATGATAATWQAAAAPVSSVFTRTGAVTAQTGDYTATQVGALASTATLNSIATANATSADVAMNSHKITGLANGSAASDAAAFGQIPTALPPNGAAGGKLTGTYPNPGIVNPIQRQADFIAAMGLIAMSYPANVVDSGTTAASQTLYGVPVYLYSGEVISNIYMVVSQAGGGTTPTLIKVGIWSSAATPVCLAVSADVQSGFAGGGVNRYQASACSYTVSSSGIYYLAFLENGAFGSPALSLGRAGALIGGAATSVTGSSPFWSTVLATSRTDMAVNDTGTYTLNTTNFWAGCA